EANATSRPRGLYGPTPDELWANRPKLTSLDRALFQDTVQRLRREVRIDQGYPTEGSLPVRDDRAVERHAIRRALVEHSCPMVVAGPAAIGRPHPLYSRYTIRADSEDQEVERRSFLLRAGITEFLHEQGHLGRGQRRQRGPHDALVMGQLVWV